MEAGGLTSLSTVRDIVDERLRETVNAPMVAVVLPEVVEVRVPDELHVMLSDLDLEAVEMLMLPLLVGVGVRRVDDSVLPPTVFDRLADISLTVNVIDLVEVTELLADKDSAMDTLSE